MVAFPLRVFIGLLNAAFVIIVGALTLTVALTFSLRTIKDNAEHSVLRLGSATTDATDAFFAKPQGRLHQLATAPQLLEGGDGVPSEGPGGNLTPADAAAQGVPGGGWLWHEWNRQCLSAFVDGGGRYFVTELYFNDGAHTFAFKNPTAKTTTQHSAFRTGPTSISSPHNTAHDVATGAFNATLTAGLAGHTYYVSDTRSTAIKSRLETATRDVDTSSTPVWLKPVYGFSHGADWMTGLVVTKIRNATTHIGYGLIYVYFEDIGVILNTAQLTPASRSFVYDRHGWLLGASGGIPSYFTEPHAPGTPAPPGCATTDESAAIYPSSKHSRACRYHIRNASHPALQKTVSASLTDDGGTSGLEGGVFFPSSGKKVYLIKDTYVFVTKLPTLAHGVSEELFIAMLVPESDMLGDAEKILPVSAGVTVGAVVLIVLFSFCLLWAILLPLEGIAVRMLKAARLEEDDETVSESVFSEVRALQKSFAAMRDELGRIRAFVPQSLLKAGVSDEEDDDDLTIDHHDPRHRSSRHSPAITKGGGVDIASVSERTGTDRLTTEDSSYHVSGSRPRLHGHRHSHRSDRGGDGGTLSSLSVTPDSVTPRSNDPSSAHLPRLPSTSHLTVSSKTRTRAKIVEGMKREAVSVLCLNLRGFNAATKGGVSSSAAAATVSAVMAAAEQEKGVVELFHGDRFVITFNAARRCANHGIRATVAAAKITASICPKARSRRGTHHDTLSPPIPSNAPRNDCQSSSVEKCRGFGVPVSAGVATGPAFVGNIGNSSMKRFSVIGPVVSQAAMLERMCKLYDGTSCLVPARLFEDLVVAVDLKTVDFVQLPHAKAPCLIGSVLGERALSGEDDEWMYQLQGGGKASPNNSPSTAGLQGPNGNVMGHGTGNGADGNPNVDPVSIVNATWEALTTGDYAKAAAQLTALDGLQELDLQGPDDSRQVLGGEADRARAAVSQGPPLCPRSLGEFYDAVCA